MRWRTGSELIHGGRDGLGLDDEGERRKKMRRKKVERREARERDKERKDKIFF